MDETLEPVRILYLEDSADDAELARRALLQHGQVCEWHVVGNGADYQAALAQGNFDLVLSDMQVLGIDGKGALEACRARWPEVPFVFLSGGNLMPRQAIANLALGAADHLHKDDMWRLVPLLQRVRERRERDRLARRARGRDRLVAVVQELSTARTLQHIMDIVRHAARELTEADGATFILRDADKCYYVEEDAIGPLWKGLRFPMSACISGWAMLNRQPAVIEDIYADERVPADAYRPTFVKSLAMVPIRTSAPIGAIGTYWARPRLATADEVALLQALADTTSVALENVQVYQELEQRVRERTAQLEDANQELAAFSYSVSHDLRAPLRAIDGFSQILQESAGEQLNGEDKHALERLRAAAQRAQALVDDMLALSRLNRTELMPRPVDLSAVAAEILDDLRAGDPQRRATLAVAPGIMAHGDQGLLRALLENLLGNAWKYSATRASTCIEFDTVALPGGGTAYRVRDNGIGFDMAYADRLFKPFQRLHGDAEYAGSGIGLATAQRIVHRHGGRIWCEAAVDQGAAFYFTLPENSAA